MIRLILFSFLLVLCFSCGDKANDKEASAKTTTNEAVSSNEASSDGVTRLTIKSGDAMKYDQDILKAKAGTEVELTLKHTGKMPKEVMGHNVAILKKGVDVTKFAQRAFNAKENGYIPEGDEVIAHTNMIGGGQSATITFTAPEKGVYDFLCTFPGHYPLMKGKFLVQ